MKKVERFKKDIMAQATYYETLDYVADYVQVFWQTTLAEEIQIPVPVEKILEQLEISVDSWATNDSLAEVEFWQGQPYIHINNKVYSFPHSNLANWLKVKCLARYIINSDVHHVTERKVNMRSGSEEFLLELPNKNETLANEIAYELMLPWKQAIDFLLEKDFGDKIIELWGREGIQSIGEAIKMDYPSEQKIFAYYHFIQTLEAKHFLKTIEESQYEKVQRTLWGLNKKICQNRHTIMW